MKELAITIIVVYLGTVAASSIVSHTECSAFEPNKFDQFARDVIAEREWRRYIRLTNSTTPRSRIEASSDNRRELQSTPWERYVETDAEESRRMAEFEGWQE
jgi:hypothetical protein